MNLAEQPLNDLKRKVETLDDMFDCPVCFERLTGNVPQCTQGHHLCRKCRARVSQCPVCKRKFIGTRNYIVESIITKFDEVKSSLTNLSAVRNPAPVVHEKKIGVSIVGEGKFPCGIEYCNKNLSFCDMFRHVKTVHKSSFTDVGPIHSYKYSYSSNIVHNPDCLCNQILYIHNMGIFFVKIDISHRGNVYGHVEIASSISDAQHFNYRLEMGDEDEVQVFQGQVVSTRAVHNKSNYVDISDLLWNYDDADDDWFNCKLTLTYVP